MAAAIDKVFKAYDVRGIYGTELDEDLAWKIGHAAAQFMRSQLSGYQRGQAEGNRLVVGRDMRSHSESLSRALIEGVTSSGIGCIDLGMCDTPMVAFAINTLGTFGGIMITASHNPLEYNGFKISGQKARPVGDATGLREIKHLVKSLRRMPASASMEKAQQVDLWPEYRKHILRFLNMPRKLRVVVDASNGMGGKMTPMIFNDQPNLEIIPLNFEIGKGFVHPPNPIIEDNLKQVKAAVREHKADFGICMDGDADRCVFVDETGTTVPSDLTTVLFAKYLLKSSPGSMIVYDLRSSRVVAEDVKAAGGVPKRERVGGAFIRKTLAENNGALGGELSGHYYFRDNFYADSGAIAFAIGATLIAGQDKPLSQLVAPLKRYFASGEINFHVEDKQGKMKEVAAKFSDAEIDQLDGVTVQYGDWWCNVRASNTEPLLRLNLEANSRNLMDEKLAQVEAMLGPRAQE